MFILDRLFIGGLSFVLDKITTVVDREMGSPEALQEELLMAQMRLELGEIDEEEFRAVERHVIERLRALRTPEAQEAEGTGTYRVTGVETALDD